MKKFIILSFLIICGGGILYTASAIFMATESYPGGTILDRQSTGYDWWNNYLSDLGRRRAWNGTSNVVSNNYFDNGLRIAALLMVVLFNLLPFLFEEGKQRVRAILVALLSFGSALAYIGIVWYPLDVNYRLHTVCVRIGFISFWILSLLFAGLIRKEQRYPNFFAAVMYLFAIVFLIQIGIMLLGPRAWSSPAALQLQVTAQKIIVGLQLFVMLIQTVGLSLFILRPKQAVN
ncbi:hypothetical protein CEQ90_07415 [Lewinellaceae bacterium SD302]|nr:hypothetical protein CEQ90_07415 [Lewinellaceae bacterium SD302]